MTKIFTRGILTRSIFDLIFPVMCVFLAIFWWDLWDKVNLQQIISYAVIFAFVMVILNSSLGLYHQVHERTIAQNRAYAILSIYISVPIAYGLFTLISISDEYQKLLLLSGVAALFGTFVHRFYGINERVGAKMGYRVLIFGSHTEAERLNNTLKKMDPQVQIVGVYPHSSSAKPSNSQLASLPRTKSLIDTAQALRVDEILIAVHERRGGVMPLRELLDCKLSGIKVLDLASYFERSLGQIRLDTVRAGWLIFGDGFRQGWRRTLSKRLFDLAVASVLLVLTFPIMLVTALLIVLESGFPIFYRQERVGYKGRLFKVIKFRSMYQDAESDGKPRWATKNDKRTTHVGHIIRKLRIDELPQIFNILANEMSLVGPRPERRFFVDQLTRDIPYYAVRHSVKPGVTGWAQVSYHYGASVDDSIQKLQYDLYYVKKHSLFLDTLILFETVGVVLAAKGT